MIHIDYLESTLLFASLVTYFDALSFCLYRRYYNNAVTDADKQDAINLFLGNFIPLSDKPALWELESDSYLHGGDSISMLLCGCDNVCH